MSHGNTGRSQDDGQRLDVIDSPAEEGRQDMEPDKVGQGLSSDTLPLRGERPTDDKCPHSYTR